MPFASPRSPSRRRPNLPRANQGQRWRARAALLVAFGSLLVTLFGAPRAVAQPAPPPAPVGAAPVGSAPAPAPNGAAPVAPVADDDEPAAAPPAPQIPKTIAEEAEGALVRKIEIDGNARVAEDRILDYLRTKEGAPFSPTTLSRDVRELWSSGLFDDIEVDLARNDDGSLDLRLHVRERPNVRAVIFEGNKAFETEKLRDDIEVKENTVLSVPAVRRSVQKIRDKYAEKGYFLAKVTSEIIPTRDNEATVKFVITEGQEVSIRKITFVGNHKLPDDELRAVMLSAQGGFLGLGSGAAYRKDVFERDVLMIQALYADKGFLAIQVSTPRVMLTPDREGIEVTIIIEEGPQFSVKRLDVYEVDPEGREIEPLGGRKALRQLVTMKAGDTFNRAALIKDLQSVKTLYKDAGYANVEADPQTQLDFDKREVSIRVPIKRGPLVHIGRIEVRGNTKTSDKVIRRELTIIEGQLYSETGLEDSRKRVLALGFFERVDVSTERGAAPDVVDAYFEVAERPTGTFQIGAGFSSIESFIATAQIQQANLFGRGQSLALQLQVSGLRQLVNLRFFEPYLFGSDWSAAVDLYSQLRIFDAFSQNSTGGQLTVGYPIIAPWLLRANLTYTGENVTVTTTQGGTVLGTSAALSFFQRLPLANLFNAGFLSSLRFSLVYDSRDNRLFPTNGIFLQGSTELADKTFGSENEFIRHRLNARFYYNLGNNWVIKSNTEWGHVTSPRESGVPIFARFFLGGIFDVRGYRLRSIGPRLTLPPSLDPNAPSIINGANIGGNMQFYTNVEFEFPILDKVGIRGVFFFDAGNSFNTESQYCGASGKPLASVVDPCNQNLLRLRTAYGTGIRWFSPLGPLRFEWGFPINRLSFEDSSVFEFTIGNFF